jgi:PEGA domain
MRPAPMILLAFFFAGGPALAQQQEVTSPPAQPQVPQSATQPASAVAPASKPQDQKPSTEGSIDAKPGAPCVILKRMGPADEITSHLYSFGIRGKQFQYVEGNLPQGVSFHGRLTDHDARNILDKGGKIQIVEPKYTAGDLDAARRQCLGLPAITVVVDSAPKPEEKPTSNGSVPTPAARPSDDAPNGTATITVSSSPDGADIYVDESFIGNAPATLKLNAGKHTIKVTMAGFKDWSREIAALAGAEAHLAASLDKLN